MVWILVGFLSLLCVYFGVLAWMFACSAERATRRWSELLTIVREVSVMRAPPPMDFTWCQPGVYIIRAVGLCKIGYASNIAQRLHSYNTSIPRGYELIAVFFCEEPARLEAELHRRFTRERRRGEWFRLSEEALEQLRTEAEAYTGR